MAEFAGMAFLAAIIAGLWAAWRNLRDAMRNPGSAPAARGFLLGAVIGWWLGGR